MSCPTCQRDDSSVLESRPAYHVPGAIRRRRECHHCGHRWTTIEVSVEAYTRLQAASEAAQAFAESILARR